MDLQGNFESLFLTSLLQLLCDESKSGMLRVTSEDKESKVFFQNGTIVYAVSSEKQSRLGYLLRNKGLISAEQLQKCLELARDQKVSLGKVLVDTGCLCRETLNEYSRQQIEEILYNMLLWDQGKFEYKDCALNLTGMMVTELNPMKLILEASRRIDEMSVLSKQITSDDLIFKISDKNKQQQEIKFTANEWRILSLVDGSRTVRQIINESGYDSFAVYKILYSIISYGLIEKSSKVVLGSGEAGDDYAAIITVYNDIIAALHVKIASELGNQSKSLLEECKAEVDKEFQALLAAYSFGAPIEQTIHAVQAAMGQFEYAEEGKHLLIKGFNAFFRSLLCHVQRILGKEQTKALLSETEKVLEYVNKYQSTSADKKRIINDVNTILIEVARQLEEGATQPKGGLFAFFGKKS